MKPKDRKQLQTDICKKMLEHFGFAPKLSKDVKIHYHSDFETYCTVNGVRYSYHKRYLSELYTFYDIKRVEKFNSYWDIPLNNKCTYCILEIETCEMRCGIGCQQWLDEEEKKWNN